MSTHGRPDWQLATVLEAEDVTPLARRLTLSRRGGERAKPGTHIDVRVPLGDQVDVRSYSVVESNGDGSRLTITVLRVRNSRGGSAFMHSLGVGDQIETTQPLQDFPLRIGAARYVLLAGGIGITALVEMARVLKSLGADYQLVYVGRTRVQMAYAAILTAQHGSRLVLVPADEENDFAVDDFVRAIAESEQATSTELYMCGPIRLMDAVRRSWATTSLSPANLRFETFGSSGWFEPEEFLVAIPELGIETTVGVNQTMLEALVEAGADLMYDCRKGECGLCRIDVVGVEGRLDHRDVFFSPAQQELDTHLCMCVTRAVADSSGLGPARVHLRP